MIKEVATILQHERYWNVENKGIYATWHIASTISATYNI